tara:strand:+ start:374 stop:955 length:582 start_codon:yes stop_codon:yes gene_type:complete
MINYKSKYLKYKFKYLNTKLKLKGGMQEDDVKNILVVCSYEEGSDFKKLEKLILGPFIGDVLNLGININITFIYKNAEGIGSSFPEDVPNEMKFDLIWFAGCNLIQSIFKVELNDLLIDIFNRTSYIVFTEIGFTKHLGLLQKNKSTIKIEDFSIQRTGLNIGEKFDYGINLINDFFEFIEENNWLFYKNKQL